MNPKITISKAIYTALFSAAMLFATTSIFAQVKIGSNPTTINAANNLEVESADPTKKVSIDKTTGKVTIADGSQGVNKVLTSDPNGVATWETSSTMVVIASSGATQQPTGLVYVPVNINFIAGNPAAWNEATGEFTAPTAGFYQINYSLEVQGPSGQTFTIEIGSLSIEDGPMRGPSGINWNNRAFTGAKFLNAGEKYSPRLYRSGSLLFDSSWKIKNVVTAIYRLF